MGNRNNPFYRIVVANQGSPNNGKAIEFLGTYDPKGGGKAILKTDRYDYWMGVGAIPSDTVRSLVPRAIEYTSTLPASNKEEQTVAAEADDTASDTPEEAPVEAEAAAKAE